MRIEIGYIEYVGRCSATNHFFDFSILKEMIDMSSILKGREDMEINSQNSEHIKKWRLIDLVNIVDEFDDCLCEKINEDGVKYAHDYRNILFFMAGKSIVTMKEIMCLIQCGYPDGALSLARNIYEQFVLSAFFEIHKKDEDFQEYVDDFWLDYEIQRNKILKYEAEFVQMDLEEKNRIEQDIAKLRTSAHHTGKQDYWWADKKSFKEVVDEVISSQPDDAYKKYVAMNHLIYKRACMALHVSSAGNMLRLGNEPEFVGIDNRQHQNGHEVPLLLAAQSFLFVLATVCDEFEIDAHNWRERLIDLLNYYTGILNPNC